jgi:hypothetical protein
LDDTGPDVTCTNCQTDNPASAQFCTHCAERLPLPLGEGFAGRYAVQAHAGIAGIGRRYHVTDDAGSPGERLTLVELRDSRAWGEEARAYYREQFAREVTLLAGLQSHSAVPRLHQSLTERDGRHFFALAGVPDATLHTALERRGRPFPPDVVIGWGIQLGEVAASLYAQTPPVFVGMHPGAVGVDGPHVRLPDLNIIRRIRTDGLPAPLEGERFAAPEEANGSPEHRSTLYRLAAMMFTLLTLEPPPPSIDPDALAQLNPRVPAWLGQLLAVNLAAAPYDRYASAADFVADLRRQKVAELIACRACGAENRRTEIYCQECGRALLESVRQCEVCEREMPVNARFCPNCGVKVT